MTETPSEPDRTPDRPELADLHELAQQLRVDSVRASAVAGSGHPTSSMSAADLMAVLLAVHLRYDFAHPDDPRNDHLIFSKGHASPLLYSMYKAAGAISDDELLTFRERGSRLEGHPTPRLPWVEVATGSLGQGLPVSAGIAWAGKWLEHAPYRVWVLCGDSELTEGSMWEAFEYAGDEQLDNLIAIVDVNRLGQRGQTRHGWDLDAYARRIGAFGWRTLEIDGHDLVAVNTALAEAADADGAPVAILARTLKGAGVSTTADRGGLHGKPLPFPHEAVAELGGTRNIRVPVHPPAGGGLPAPARPTRGWVEAFKPPAYRTGEAVATRAAYGEALAALGTARPDVVVLDAEVGDSTRTEAFAEAFPDRFLEIFIAEQQMVAAAVGLQVRGWVPFATTFAAFLTRAYDFARMAAVSRANLRLVGSHAGVAIGQDGPSQMGLEDLAAFRAVHGSTVLYPCDANQTTHLVATMSDLPGVSYLRTTRGPTPVLYPPDAQFPVGGSRMPRHSPDDQVTVVAAGVTVTEALAAADVLAAEGLAVRVIDAYSVKPIDVETLRVAARLTGRVLTVEDHHPEGGLGDAVLDAFADPDGPNPRVRKLAVRNMPGSATPAEQLHVAGIDAEAIAAAARHLASR